MLTKERNSIIAMRKSGVSIKVIADHFSLSPQAVSKALIEWGYRTYAKRKIKPDRPPEGYVVPQMVSGEWCELGGIKYTFEGHVSGKRPMFLFKSEHGWRESFFDDQLKEAIHGERAW